MIRKYAVVAVLSCSTLIASGCSMGGSESPETSTETVSESAFGTSVETENTDGHPGTEDGAARVEQDAKQEQEPEAAEGQIPDTDSEIHPQVPPPEIDESLVSGSLLRDEAPAEGAGDSAPAPSSEFKTDKSARGDGGADLTPRAVRVGSYGIYDRVIIEFSGTGEPGWDAEYLGYSVSGEASDSLALTVSGTPERNDWPEDLSPTGFFDQFSGVVKDVYCAGAAGNESVWTVETSGTVPYAVKTLQSPPRLVIDFKS